MYFGRRLAELAGLLVLALAGCFTLALVSWSALDPSLNYATDAHVRNLLGTPGAIVADLFMQLFGLATIAFLPPLVAWSLALLSKRRLDRIAFRILCMLAGVLCAATLISLFPSSSSWPLPTGLGGVVGDAILAVPRKILGGGVITRLIFGGLAGILAIIAFTAAMTRVGDEDPDAQLADSKPAPARAKPTELEDDDDRSSEPGLALTLLGGCIHMVLSFKGQMLRMFRSMRGSAASNRRQQALRHDLDDEAIAATMPGMPSGLPRRAPPPPLEAEPRTSPALRRRETIDAPFTNLTARDDEDDADVEETRVAKPAPPLKPGKRVAREAQPSFLDRSRYELPPLLLLSEAKKIATSKVSADALEQNARLLEGVLDDFGVKGEIINVRPGPVVTLYELEPAPGIKSSRVIGLADDIARSMSAISARVAVVQGRNAIGIELPNQRRETVYLRELLASEDFEKSKHRLAIALGKTIGGEPVIVDLARMPHLLVAGTTGSGKSVAINTMILSLLYRLKPEDCRLIMVDPKMLELSVYDGIPHLLTPVVTDPKKAVVALKWAVREMEDRYKKMSKVGVRNIDGFNARIAEAAAKGEVITRTVQTGYDRETGEAI
ncbi:MAG: cell division protein FtsK, partial [Hyphomicrobiales bacterium]|nr:cell division protein FtsK [Hyphomicrobiales bacterium]